jgi:hypothetical protein
MRWFRSRARWGSCLALFALALQLALTFGHLHLDGIASGGAPAIASAQAPTGAQPAPDPDGDKSPARANHYCAVCAVIHLASSVSPVEGPSLPLPVSFARLRLEAAVELGSTGPNHTPFAARAPPLA